VVALSGAPLQPLTLASGLQLVLTSSTPKYRRRKWERCREILLKFLHSAEVT
jgi:hypothetical protein